MAKSEVAFKVHPSAYEKCAQNRSYEDKSFKFFLTPPHTRHEKVKCGVKNGKQGEMERIK